MKNMSIEAKQIAGEIIEGVVDYCWSTERGLMVMVEVKAATGTWVPGDRVVIRQESTILPEEGGEYRCLGADVTNTLFLL